MNEIDDILLPQKKKNIETNLVPLINVVFLLLIFFLVAGKISGIQNSEVQIPTASAKQIVADDAVRIILSLDKKITINDKKLSPDEIKSVDLYLQNILQKNLEKQVVIDADARLDALYLTEILQIISDIGSKNIIIGVKNAK